MTVVSRTISTSHIPAISALKALASLVGFNESSISFASDPSNNDNGFSVEMKVTAHNPFSGTSVDYTVSGFVECAKAICKAVPESGLWGQMGESSENESLIESWIQSTVDALVGPAYVTSDSKGKYLSK